MGGGCDGDTRRCPSEAGDPGPWLEASSRPHPLNAARATAVTALPPDSGLLSMLRSRPPETRPPEEQPPEERPPEERPPAAGASGSRSPGARPLGSRPLGSRSLGSRSLGSRPLGSRPLGSRPLGSRSLGSGPLGSGPRASSGAGPGHSEQLRAGVEAGKPLPGGAAREPSVSPRLRANVATAPTIRTAPGLLRAGLLWNFPRRLVTIKSHRASD
jgi:hypothetical protein